MQESDRQIHLIHDMLLVKQKEKRQRLNKHRIPVFASVVLQCIHLAATIASSSDRRNVCFPVLSVKCLDWMTYGDAAIKAPCIDTVAIWMGPWMIITLDTADIAEEMPCDFGIESIPVLTQTWEENRKTA